MRPGIGTYSIEKNPYSSKGALVTKNLGLYETKHTQDLGFLHVGASRFRLLALSCSSSSRHERVAAAGLSFVHTYGCSPRASARALRTPVVEEVSIRFTESTTCGALATPAAVSIKSQQSPAHTEKQRERAPYTRLQV
jgi:hypothetical protein